ncbi:MAG: hypothetical protein JWR25_1396 [Noviherbaspirillum sp.]|nr:hypothetical protein [Noviherbaspirillum sp.]
MDEKTVGAAARRINRFLASCLIAAAGLSATAGAVAQTWPTKPIRFIVPYPAAGGTDIVARLVGAKISQKFGQPVIIDNKPGASSIIGTDLLAKAPPDGYTMGLITGSHAINPMFFPKLPYDTLKDFDMVSQLVSQPMVLVAHPSLNLKSVQDLVELAKSRPGKLNYASIGNGSPHNLAMEWLKSLTGADLTHVPYRGVAPAVNDLVGGQIDAMFVASASAEQFVKSGRLTVLAVASAKREPAFPNVPTVAESGVPQFDLATWYALAVPAGTPRNIRVRLSQEVALALEQPDVKEKLAAMGAVGTPTSPDDTTAFMAREVQKWSRIIKLTGAKPE